MEKDSKNVDIHTWSIRLLCIGILCLFAATYGYREALVGASVSSPNVAPIEQAKSSSALKYIWFGNFNAAKKIFYIFFPMGIIFIFLSYIRYKVEKNKFEKEGSEIDKKIRNSFEILDHIDEP